jgi:hypothetical protein
MSTSESDTTNNGSSDLPLLNDIGRGYLDQIGNLMENPGELMTFGNNLEAIAFGAARQGVIDAVVGHLSPQLQERIVDLYGRFEVLVDEGFVRDVIAGHISRPEEYRFTPFYQQLARNEYELAGLKPGDRVIHYGSGPCPGTDIWLYKQFGVPVIGVEIDPIRADEARQLLDKFGLYGPDALSVVTAEAAFVNSSDSKLVIISAMVPTVPTEKSVYNLVRLASPGGNSPEKVILREPYGAGKLFYPPITGKANFHHFEEIGNTLSKLTPEDRILSRLFRVSPLGRVEAGHVEAFTFVTGLVNVH